MHRRGHMTASRVFEHVVSAAAPRVAGVAVRDESKWGLSRRSHGQRAIACRMPGARTQDLAADYFAAKRLRKFAKAGGYIVACVSQLAYGLTVHLENSSSYPRRPALRLG